MKSDSEDIDPADNDLPETARTEHSNELGSRQSSKSSENTPAIRISIRSNKGKALKRFGYNENFAINAIIEPRNYKEVKEDLNKDKWIAAMKEE